MINPILNEEQFKDTTININGVITPIQEAKISVFDRGFLFGDSVYEVTYTENNTILYFDEHLTRLYNSAKILKMSIKMLQKAMFFVSRNVDRILMCLC